MSQSREEGANRASPVRGSYPQILVTLWQPVIELRWPVGMNRVRLTKDLLEQGYTYDELARRARGAELVRIRRGAYATRSEQLLDARVAHLHLLEATVGQCDRARRVPGDESGPDSAGSVMRLSPAAGRADRRCSAASGYVR